MSILKVDYTYFKGDFLIPGLEAQGIGISSSAAAAKKADLDDMITVFEPRFLSQVLGKTLAEEFIAGIQVETIDAKWSNLYNQLVNTTDKTSPFVNFVYWYYLRKESENMTGEGENVQGVSPIERQIRIWNEMVNTLLDTMDFIEDNMTVYSDYNPRNKRGWLNDVYQKQSIF